MHAWSMAAEVNGLEEAEATAILVDNPEAEATAILVDNPEAEPILGDNLGDE